jgi:hypothetical protein
VLLDQTRKKKEDVIKAEVIVPTELLKSAVMQFSEFPIIKAPLKQHISAGRIYLNV